MCYKNKHFLIFSLRLLKIRPFVLINFQNLQHHVKLYLSEQKFKDGVKCNKLHKILREKPYERRYKCPKKKQGHKLVFFAWQKDRPQNELLWENHHVKLHDYFGWGVFWDKTWKVIVGNDIIVRNNKHVELSGNQSAITKVWLKKNMNFLKNWRIACF